MRSKCRTALLALVAVLALGAVAASAASAATPSFVLKAGESFPTSLGSSMHAGSVSFAWPTMTWGTCSENATEGTITGPKTVSLTLDWAGCSSGWHSEGSAEGHVVLTGTGTLTYIKRSPEQVGIVVAIKEVKIISGGSSIKLRGSLVIPVTPLGKETSKLALPIHTKSLGVQEFTSYENEKLETIEARPEIEFGSAFKQAGIELQGGNELTTGTPLTIKVVTPPPPPALPEFVLGKGEAFPVSLEGSSPAAKTGLYSAAGDIGCEGVNSKGTISASRSLSSLTYELEHCKEVASGTECQTGTEAGHVALTGTGELFYIKKSEENVGLVFTVSLAKITCGSTKVKAEGKLVIPVTPIGAKTKLLTFTLTRIGGTDENSYTKYENEKGEATTTELELNFGSGYKKGALETGELDPTASKALTVEG